MKHALPPSLLACLLAGLFASLFARSGFAQERIYRCGNEYTNTAPAGQKNNCKLVAGGNVTVVPAQRAQATPAVRPASSAQNGARVDAPEQRARDSDARLILESELKKTEARLAELRKEYNQGEPEKLGPETRNHQKYLDRVAELKAGIERVESDVSGLQRELSRLPASK
jgi:hypothetical protein